MENSSLLRLLRENPLILPLYLPSLIFSFSQGILVPILPLYAADFEVSYSLVGLLLAMQGLGMLISDMPTGILLRRFGRKWSMVLGLGCMVLAGFGLFGAGSIYLALFFRLFSGFGMALFGVAQLAYMAEVVQTGSRGRAIALYGGVNRIGKFIGPGIGGTVAAIYGLRGPFVVYALAALAILVVVALFVRRTHSEIAEKQVKGGHLGHFRSTLKEHYRILTTAGIAQLFAQMIRTSRDVIIPLYAADILGLDIQAIGWVVSISSGIDMTLFLPAGYIMDRWGRKFAIVPCFLIQAIGMALIPLTGGFLSLTLVTSLIGFGNGLGSGTMMTLGTDLAPPASRGEFLGIWRFVGDGGQTAAPLIVGSVADAVGLQLGALAMAGSGIIAVLIFAFLVPETLKKKQPVTTAVET